MHRATPKDTSLRSYTSGGSRGVVDTIDDNKLMQTHKGTMQGNEARDDIESPQNYGFTSNNMPSDTSGGAETFHSYMNGSRSFPIPGPIDDRRHRLRGLSSGDSAMHRTKDDDQQFHLASDGTYNSVPTSKKIRSQLVASGSGMANPPQNQSQASQAKRSLYATFESRIEARLWAGLEPELELELELKLGGRERAAARAGNGGGGSSGGGGQQSQQNKPTGQKAVAGAGANSADFHELSAQDHRLSSASKVSLASSKADDDVLHQTKNKNDYCGGTPDAHKFAKVMTLSGPAFNVWGRIG
jgi:hypothetical protein